jgi:hypothetical protein
MLLPKKDGDTPALADLSCAPAAGPHRSRIDRPRRNSERNQSGYCRSLFRSRFVNRSIQPVANNMAMVTGITITIVRQAPRPHATPRAAATQTVAAVVRPSRIAWTPEPPLRTTTLRRLQRSSLRSQQIRSRDGRGRMHTNILPPCRGSFAPSEAVPSGTVAPISRAITLEPRYGCGVHPDDDESGGAHGVAVLHTPRIGHVAQRCRERFGEAEPKGRLAQHHNPAVRGKTARVEPACERLAFNRRQTSEKQRSVTHEGGELAVGGGLRGGRIIDARKKN